MTLREALEDARLKLSGALAMLQSEEATLLPPVNYDGSGWTCPIGLCADIENAIERIDKALEESLDNQDDEAVG